MGRLVPISFFGSVATIKVVFLLFLYLGLSGLIVSCTDDFSSESHVVSPGKGVRKIQTVGDDGDLHNRAIAAVYATSLPTLTKYTLASGEVVLSRASCDTIVSRIKNWAYQNYSVSAVDAAVDTLWSVINASGMDTTIGGVHYIRNIKYKYQDLSNVLVSSGRLSSTAKSVIAPIIASADANDDIANVHDDILAVNPSSYSYPTNNQLAEFRLIADSSFSYWTDTTNPGANRARFKLSKGSWVIVGDTIGGIIGMMGGGISSWLCGGYASVYLNETLPDY